MQQILNRAWRRLRREGRDLFEVVLLPGLAAMLPWPVAFGVFRRLAHWPWLYREECMPALAQAKEHGHCSDERAWAWERRLVTLLDHADHYLFRTRSDAWMERHVQVAGDWGETGSAGLLWTLHWGTGLWALRHARVAGLHPNMVLDAPRGPDFAGRTVFGRYVRARMRSVERALERPIVFAPGAMDGVRSALARREQVAVVMDVPQDQVKVTRATTILGQPVSVPAALADMAVAQALPVTVFCMGVDLRTGRRQLSIVPLGVALDTASLTDRAFAQLDRLLKASPAAWHLWAQAPRFFTVRPADLAAGARHQS